MTEPRRAEVRVGGASSSYKFAEHVRHPCRRFGAPRLHAARFAL